MRRFLAAPLLLLAACGPSTETGADAGTPGDTFIALPRDFAEFRTWHKVQVSESDTEVGPHPTGTRFAYVNRLPPHGSTTFPVGTIILKTVETNGQLGTEMHAMVKRHATDFNALGAKGWEWFELGLSVSGAPVVVWRGSRPPDGEGYGGGGSGPVGPAGDCNACHKSAETNDYVQSTPLKLSEF